MSRTALNLLLALVAAGSLSAAPALPARSVHYKPEGRTAVCVNGSSRYNRALYGAHSGFRMECSDTPVFGIYLPGMGGNLSLTLPQGDCTAIYSPGRMDYSQGGVEVEAQVTRSDDAALWRLTNTSSAEVSVPVTFGGVAGKNFSRNGDLGVDAPDCFDLKPEYTAGNQLSLSGDRLTVDFGRKERRQISLIIPASSASIGTDNIYHGTITLAPGQSKTIAYYPDTKPRKETPEAQIARAEKERQALASTLSISTPDPWLNPVGEALAVAADGIWSGEAWLHGSIGWRTPHLGWRGAYAGDALGWHDRSLTHLSTYADNQVTDIPATIPHPAQDPKMHYARALKKWGTPMYSNGYICRRPGKKNEMSHYDMNMVYADAMVRHFLHTGDKESMRKLFPVLKRHLDWEKLNFDPDGDHLYDAYCCIWASDALYYGGGAVTHSSAYNYFANLMAARVAEAIGEDPTPYLNESSAIAAAVDSVLWIPSKGTWAEFRDLGGHSRLHPYPAVWTIYHAIDSDLGDPFKRYAATCYIDREIPHVPVGCADSLYVVSTTNWKPYSWSINNVAIAEIMHTALAYWQAGRPDEAYALMKGVMMDNMYGGASPLNFGQISQLDAARGECYRDFADPIGVWSRALTEGLYGIRPDLLARKVTVTPGFPSDWNEASISLPDISYSFDRTGHSDTYTVEGRYAKGTEITLQVPAAGLKGITVNGKKASWKALDNSIGTPRVAVTFPSGKKTVVKIDRSASSTAMATGRVRSEGPVKFTEMKAGDLTWWEADSSAQVDPSSDIFATTPSLSDFTEVQTALCDPVPMSGSYNASVSDIFRNKYLSPRPSVTTLQIPEQGIGEWCHPDLTAEICDSGLRAVSAANNGIVTVNGIPFLLPSEGMNVAYTTLWDNYPDSVKVALNGKASHLYLLMAGSTNHMQWGMENARLTVNYADGESESFPLVNPVNWAPIEQDFYTDAYAYRQPSGAPRPMRVHLASGEASRSLGERLGAKGPMERSIPSGAAILLDLPVDQSRELASLSLETVSNDVVTGIMGITAQRPEVLTDWYNITVENKPYVRWWWHGSAVDSIGLTYNLEEFARQGIGGVEITPIYGVQGNESNDIDFLSDRWMDMLGHVVRESERLGLQVDMNNGTGWPFGGPNITPEHSARKLVTRKWKVNGGTSLSEALFPVEKQPDATLQRIVAISGDRRLDITDKATDGRIIWEAPASDNDWTVYAIYSGRTNQKVKRAAPGGVGLVLNHYDSISVKKYLERFDQAFRGREWMIPTSFFNDSYEVYGSDWDDKLLDEFERDHGYRLDLLIDTFIGDNGESPERAKVLHDYRRTLGRMLEENFTAVWIDWAHRHGATIRNQSHGSPANILDLYAQVDIPECESFGQTDFDIPGLHPTGPKRHSDSAPSVVKFASSAAHLAGKPYTSSETLTWLTEHFRTPLSRCKPELDQMFCSGVNHIYFHGAPYSPKDVAFPGWLFYASINMSPTAALWENVPGLLEYIARVQSFLVAGQPDNDLLMYFPYDDVLTRTQGNPYLMFDIHKMERVMPDVKSGMDRLVKAGYDVDYLSDRLIDSLTVTADGNLLSRGGNIYRAIIVPEVKVIPEDTRARFADLQRQGVTVIYSADIPATADTLALPSLEPLRKRGVNMIRRKNEEGGHNYFLSVLRDLTIDEWVPLAVTARDVMIFDPLTGKKGKALSRTGADGNVEVKLQLLPGESILLKTFPMEIDAPDWQYVARRGKSIDINRGWSLSFPKSDPEIAETFSIDRLCPWTAIDNDSLKVNYGTGRYTVEFNVDKPSKADDWELDLGDVRESARVKVNGVEAGTVWSVPMRLRIGHLLKPGKNTLEVDVTNLEANRIADFERRGVKWRIFKDANIASVTNAKQFSFGDWELQPSGLNSSVKLTPVYYNNK